jgi:hypothetical protein
MMASMSSPASWRAQLSQRRQLRFHHQLRHTPMMGRVPPTVAAYARYPPHGGHAAAAAFAVAPNVSVVAAAHRRHHRCHRASTFTATAAAAADAPDANVDGGEEKGTYQKVKKKNVFGTRMDRRAQTRGWKEPPDGVAFADVAIQPKVRAIEKRKHSDSAPSPNSQKSRT